MAHLEDGWIDAHRAEAIAQPPARERNADTVRQEIERFRGQVLSAAYGLERELDNLVIFHLFGFRHDETPAFFDEHILQNLGLERKVRLGRLIISEWPYDEDVERERLGSCLGHAKVYRDRIAHWPTRLQPLTVDGQTVDFRVHLHKGGTSFVLNERVQAEWLGEIVEAKNGIEALVLAKEELKKAGFDDE